MQTKKSLEDLIPLILTEKHKKALKELREHQKEYFEICKETKEFLMDEVWLELNFSKLHMNYFNIKEPEDEERVMYGLMLKKGYKFT
ncbi:MAG: hypothetical protein QT11_C0001G0914 [archaeon GW2011_AR20]|nr:MAG: hypothetical protein QT11_C0001G0914 [archaeon GW2011_AR20]MBS3160139.1 hypothetical protein [Candidatus Woesearchaeota archaeon]